MTPIKEELIAFLASLQGASDHIDSELDNAMTLLGKPHINIPTIPHNSLTLPEEEKLKLLEFVMLIYSNFPELKRDAANIVNTKRFFDTVGINDEVLASESVNRSLLKKNPSGRSR